MKRLLYFILFFALIILALIVYVKFFTKKISPLQILPTNTMVIMECENPFTTWNRFIKNPLWKYLKKNTAFEDIDYSLSNFDSLIQKNKFFSKFLLSRNFTLSIIHENDIEKFIYIIDLRGLGKLIRVEKIIKSLYLKDITFKANSYNGYPLYEIYDNKGITKISMTIIENLLVFTKDLKLLKNIIKQSKENYLISNKDFVEVYDKLKNKGLIRISFNNPILKNYIEKKLLDKSVLDFIRSFSFTSINFILEKEGSFYLDGIMKFRDDINTFYSNFKNIKGGNHRSLEIIPDQFASFALLGIESGKEFIDYIKQNNLEVEKSINQLEEFLKIDVNKNFIEWIDDEICILQIPPSEFNKKNDLAIIIKTKNINDAIKGLENIKKQIRKKTPLKFKEINYKNHTISYLHVPFFLKLLFGKFFDKLEKPYYTIIDNYVVFSNYPQTLINIIDNYVNNNVVLGNDKSTKFLKNFTTKTLFLVYLKPSLFINRLKDYLSEKTYYNIRKNKNYYICFSDVGLSIKHDKRLLDVRIYFNFDSTNVNYLNFKMKDYKSINPDTLLEIDSISINTESEDISMTEEELKVYENEKVHKEFYSNGNLKIFYKIKKGKKNGEYLEYYENGNIKIKGKFKDDLMTGEWKFFDENGFLIEKKYYKEGIPLE